MVKVLTIRDPKTGTLIAEEPIRPDEDEDSALARMYRKTLGPDAPEFRVITPSVWHDEPSLVRRSWPRSELRRGCGRRSRRYCPGTSPPPRGDDRRSPTAPAWRGSSSCSRPAGPGRCSRPSWDTAAAAPAGGGSATG